MSKDGPRLQKTITSTRDPSQVEKHSLAGMADLRPQQVKPSTTTSPESAPDVRPPAASFPADSSSKPADTNTTDSE